MWCVCARVTWSDDQLRARDTSGIQIMRGGSEARDSFTTHHIINSVKLTFVLSYQHKIWIVLILYQSEENSKLHIQNDKKYFFANIGLLQLIDLFY